MLTGSARVRADRDSRDRRGRAARRASASAADSRARSRRARRSSHRGRRRRPRSSGRSGRPVPPGRRVVEQAAHLAVDRLDFAPVAAAAASSPAPVVGRMRVVEVDPEKERPCRNRPSSDRGQRGIDDGRGRALRIAELTGALGGHPVVVDPETTLQPEAPVEHPRADDRDRRVAGAVQQLGEGRESRSRGLPGRCRAGRADSGRGR